VPAINKEIMEEGTQRNVFNANLVLDRKSVITAVGIDHEGSRVFLGLEEGMLEEYSLDMLETSPTCSLTARKPIAAKVTNIKTSSLDTDTASPPNLSINSYHLHLINWMFTRCAGTHYIYPTSYISKLPSTPYWRWFLTSRSFRHL
jgi:hypothetical protein